jgi:hypothetical protein
MRYFVVMNDHTIKPATNVSKCWKSDKIYFDVDDKMYRYLTVAREYTCRKFNHLLIPANAFQRFMHEDWYETREIEYLLALDEEENEEMNYFQSTDFNAGFIYNQVERQVVPLINKCSADSLESEITVPRIQVMPKGCSAIQEMDTLKATMRCVVEHFDAVYGKSFTLEFGSVYTQKQYFHFPYIITRKTECKEMTIAEIEEALGYKVKVVGDK